MQKVRVSVERRRKQVQPKTQGSHMSVSRCMKSEADDLKPKAAGQSGTPSHPACWLEKLIVFKRTFRP